jgi:uncharacterized Fe-S cluster protein YjdI
MADTTKEYSNGEVTIVWKPEVCIHSAFCVGGLPSVFNNKARPWINAQGANTDEIKAQVSKCPSGALTYYMNNAETEAPQIESESVVEIVPNGPVLVFGNVRIKHSDGREEHKNKMTALCRCGASSNKPFCDGTHKKNGFQG